VGPALIAVLQQTGKLQMAYGLLFAVGLAITL
jgi:1,4-dihydroxy-2-naphthoate octaprenyltransferase